MDYPAEQIAFDHGKVMYKPDAGNAGNTYV
jgi:hypothetical protein